MANTGWIDASNQYITFSNRSNIASIGNNSFNTIALPKNGGKGMMEISIASALFNYGTINHVIIKYSAYGSRTGVLGSKAQITTGYVDANGSQVDVHSHGDVGRGSGNATSYSDTLYPTHSSTSGCRLYFKCKNPIAAQTNTVYVNNISIYIDYTPAYGTIKTASSPAEGGTVTGGGSYPVASTVTLVATPNNGYKFVKWDDGETSATRTVSVTLLETTYTALFESTKINNVFVNTVQPKAIYFDKSNIVFVVDGDIPSLSGSIWDTVDGFNFKVQNTVPSGMTEAKEVYVDLKKYYG